MNNSDLSDQEILEAIHTGSEIAFRRLILRYQNQLKRFVAVILQSQDLVDEVVHDTFVTFWTKFVLKKKKVEQIRSLLFRIARNKAIDTIRKQRLYNFCDYSSEDLSLCKTPQSELKRKQLNIMFAKVFSQLPQFDREIFELFYVEKLKIREIAVVTAQNPETVSSRLRRAREKIKNLLPETFFEEWIETYETTKKINI